MNAMAWIIALILPKFCILQTWEWKTTNHWNPWQKWQLLLLQIFWIIRQLKIVATVCLNKNACNDRYFTTLIYVLTYLPTYLLTYAHNQLFYPIILNKHSKWNKQNCLVDFMAEQSVYFPDIVVCSCARGENKQKEFDLRYRSNFFVFFGHFLKKLRIL